MRTKTWIATATIAVFILSLVIIAGCRESGNSKSQQNPLDVYESTARDAWSKMAKIEDRAWWDYCQATGWDASDWSFRFRCRLSPDDPLSHKLDIGYADRASLGINVLRMRDMLWEGIPYGFTPKENSLYGGSLKLLGEGQGLLSGYKYYIINTGDQCVILGNDGQYWIL